MKTPEPLQESGRPPNTCRYSLGEVGEVLDDFSDERERARRAVVRIFLHQVEERRRHDGGAEEAQEQRGADQTLADVLLVAAGDALLLPRREHFLQLPRKHAEETGRKQKGRIRLQTTHFMTSESFNQLKEINDISAASPSSLQASKPDVEPLLLVSGLKCVSDTRRHPPSLSPDSTANAFTEISQSEV